ncbi:MAG: 1-acyl-sn-glycerol-3-phosphate acyltransferase [Bacilli bacterium]|nr:1-acyl-sn-glycerol-3-phosphate acyltransferase [Bacilli bacterium]
MKPEWKKTHIIYWSDELNDDFNRLDAVEDNPPLKKNYKYIHKNPIRRMWDGFLYYVIAKPFIGGYCLFHGIRWKNKKNLRRLRGRGAFLYGNHVAISDVFKFQSFIIHTKKVNIIGLSNASAIPVAKHLVKSLGYIPIADDSENLLHMKQAIEFLVKKRGQYVLVYPEAHIWPYYTKIRDFKNVSFYYPAQCLAPVVPFVTVWRKVWYSKKPRQTVIFGRPIYPDKSATVLENRDYLAEECKKQMNHLASSIKQVEYIKYIKKEKENA